MNACLFNNIINCFHPDPKRLSDSVISLLWSCVHTVSLFLWPLNGAETYLPPAALQKHKPVCFFNIHEHGINVRVWMSINIQGVMNVKPTQTGSIWAWCLFACRSVVRVFILTQSAFALAESPDCNNTTLKDWKSLIYSVHI